MYKQTLFFNVEELSADEHRQERLEISAGTFVRTRQVNQGFGDILMYLPSTELDRSAVTGYLAYPERADFRFDGTLKAMKALWMATGVKTRFLSDPRFQFERV